MGLTVHQMKRKFSQICFFSPEKVYFLGGEVDRSSAHSLRKCRCTRYRSVRVSVARVPNKPLLPPNLTAHSCWRITPPIQFSFFLRNAIRRPPQIHNHPPRQRVHVKHAHAQAKTHAKTHTKMHAKTHYILAFVFEMNALYQRVVNRPTEKPNVGRFFLGFRRPKTEFFGGGRFFDNFVGKKRKPIEPFFRVGSQPLIPFSLFFQNAIRRPRLNTFHSSRQQPVHAKHALIHASLHRNEPDKPYHLCCNCRLAASNIPATTVSRKPDQRARLTSHLLPLVLLQ